MKKVIFIAALLASSMAMAGNDNANPCGNNGNNCGGSVGNVTATNGPINNNSAGGNATGGAGGQGGSGGTGVGLAIAGAASSAEAKANAAAIAAQEQAQKQGQAQGQIANGGKATGGTGNGTVVTTVGISGDERSAPAVFAGNIPTVATSCRLYLFGGGTNVNGAVSGTFPIGNDQSCLTDKGLANMLRVNQQFPGAYTANDLKIVACKVEGMSDTDSCKEIK